jgi:hypothetical protein
MKNRMKNAKLCYVDSPWAYFTTQELSKQWGDDWNDHPYEHNSGTPYDWGPNSEGGAWDIYKVAFDADGLVEPRDGHLNSPFSVEQINAGAIAWLRSSQWSDNKIVIPAGTPLEKFIELVHEADGTVYISAIDLSQL